MEVQLTRNQSDLLRASFDVARAAAEAGNHPFGAILADDEGRIVLQSGNTVVTEDDITGHAETNLVRMIRRESFDPANLTMYASTEPCPMCSGAIYWGNIGRVIFGLGQKRFYSILSGTGVEESFILHCRDVLARGSRQIEVIGPALENEAAQVHEGFWL